MVPRSSAPAMVPAAEGEDGQHYQREGDEREAGEVRPVDAIFYGGAVVVEGGGGLEVFEVFRDAA